MQDITSMKQALDGIFQASYLRKLGRHITLDMVMSCFNAVECDTTANFPSCFFHFISTIHKTSFWSNNKFKVKVNIPWSPHKARKRHIKQCSLFMTAISTKPDWWWMREQIVGWCGWAERRNSQYINFSRYKDSLGLLVFDSQLVILLYINASTT